jgi:dTDP-4-dehydrorhamnose 3,5-epimerase
LDFLPLAIPAVVLVRPKVHGDGRGFFMETWHKRKFAAAGIDVDFVQDNHSASARGVLRGLHYQLTGPQGKLVRAIAGEVFDVAVDLRRSSPTFGRWVAARLSAENKDMLWVPAGFAHGFLTLSERAEVIYKCTALYAPEDERVIAWNDPEVGIDWPLPAGATPTLSKKDAAAERLRDAEVYP